MRLTLVALSVVSLLLLAGLFRPARAEQRAQNNLPPDYEIELYLAEVTFPLAMAFAPDGRLFFAERYDSLSPPVNGLIRVVSPDGTLQPEPFVEIPLPDDAPSVEKGLLGLALDPEFDSNSYVYAFRTAAPDSGNPTEHNEVLRYTAVISGTALIGSEMTRIVDDLPANPTCCHNGGALDFGPDGKLYVSLGDVVEPSNGQNLATRAATIMRFNPDGTIPPDNPFVDDPEADPAIYAYGLRNTFGIAWDPATGYLYGTDNGPNCNDELNKIVAGGNYGWAESDDGDGCKALPPPYIAPIYIWEDTIGPSGATFYEGGSLSAFQGDLFLASWNGGEGAYTNGILFQVSLTDDGNSATVTDLFQNCGQPGPNENMLDIETGPDGALYFSCQQELYPTPLNTGAIYRIVSSAPTPTNAAASIALDTISSERNSRLLLGGLVAIVVLGLVVAVAQRMRGGARGA